MPAFISRSPTCGSFILCRATLTLCPCLQQQMGEISCSAAGAGPEPLAPRLLHWRRLPDVALPGAPGAAAAAAAAAIRFCAMFMLRIDFQIGSPLLDRLKMKSAAFW